MKTNATQAKDSLKVIASLILAVGSVFLAGKSLAVTITDPFTNSASWGTPFTEAGKNMAVANGRMNFTSSTTGDGGAGLTRSTPLLTTTQSWSIKVDVHIDPFVITNEAHGVSVFLGFGKTSDYLGTHILLGFDRDWWDTNYYGINDDVQVNDVSIPGFTNLNYLPSGDAALRLDFNAANQTITYSYDANGAAGGYNWTAMGTTNIASGTYNLQLGPADTLSVLLAGWSNMQVVTNGQAYLDNLEITMEPTFAPDTIAGYSIIATVTNVNGSPISPVSVTNFWGASTFSQIGPNSDNTYSGTYTYVKTGTNTGTIFTYKTAPPDQAGETGTNHLVFDSPLAGRFAHYYDFDDTPPTVQYGTFQVVQTNGLTGSLRVTISPTNAVSAGAQWQVDGGAWQNHSNIVSGLSGGNHTVSYKTVSGWNTPANQTVVVSAGTTSVTNGIYTPQSGSLQVTITPAGAVSAGAQWQVDAGAWQNSGNTVSNLTLGNHTVAYKSTPGWAQPGNQTVTTAANTTTTTNGTYVASDFTLSLSNGAFVVTGYTGAGGAVAIPSIINGLPVTSIGDMAFLFKASVTGITIPSSVTNIGVSAFSGTGLTSVTVPNSVTRIGMGAFNACSSLTSVTLPDSVTIIEMQTFQMCGALTKVSLGNGLTQIGSYAFEFCTSLRNINIPASVVSIGDFAFEFCPQMMGIYFRGNAPSLGGVSVFTDNPTTVYYLPGSSDWTATYGGRPTALWRPQVLSSDSDVGVRTNQFGFNVSWAAGRTIVTEAGTNLANPVWLPLKTNILATDTIYFSDPQWTNYPRRFYRIRSP